MNDDSSSLPELLGNVLVGFVDIVSSTAIMNAQGIAADYQMKESFSRAAAKRARECGVTLVNSTGDGFLFVLEAGEGRAARLASFARLLSADFRLLLERSEVGIESGLRFGVARGSILRGTIAPEGKSESLITGPVVSMASRLCDRAETGEMIVCERTLDEMCGSLRVTNKAACRLKGFASAVETYHLEVTRGSGPYSSMYEARLAG